MEQELIFTKENGYKIAGKVFRPDDSGRKYPTAIFSHGFGSNYRELEHHGAVICGRQMNCVFFDYCGGGPDTLSDGTMHEMTVLTEADDLFAVVSAVRELDYVDPEQIYLIGESMGGFVSAYVAAKIPDVVKGLVLWYPAFIIPEDARARYEAGKTTALGFPISPDYNKAAMGIDIYNLISNYKNPVKIIHGDEDTIVPLRYSEEALKYYEDVSLMVIKGAGHGFDGKDSIRAGEETAAFIENCMLLTGM